MSFDKSAVQEKITSKRTTRKSSHLLLAADSIDLILFPLSMEIQVPDESLFGPNSGGISSIIIIITMDTMSFRNCSLTAAKSAGLY